MNKTRTILVIILLCGVGAAYWTGLLFPGDPAYYSQTDGFPSKGALTFILGILPFLIAGFFGYLVVTGSVNPMKPEAAARYRRARTRLLYSVVIFVGLLLVYSAASSWGYVRGVTAREISWLCVALGAFFFILPFVRKRRGKEQA